MICLEAIYHLISGKTLLLTCTRNSPKFFPNINMHAWNFEISLGDQFSAPTPSQHAFPPQLTEWMLSPQRVEQNVEGCHLKSTFLLLLLLALSDQTLDQSCRLLLRHTAWLASSCRLCTLCDLSLIAERLSSHPRTSWTSSRTPIREAAQLDVRVEDAHRRFYILNQPNPNKLTVLLKLVLAQVVIEVGGRRRDLLSH